LALLTGNAGAQADRPTLRAERSQEPIVVDGQLDELAWESAAKGGDFLQREPSLGSPATERTELAIVYTPSTIYIGVRAFDSEPEKLIAKEMGRDRRLSQDDSIGLVLDTFNDDRNAYFFETNPNEARSDALITDEGRDVNFNWDGVWQVATTVDDQGWIAEIAIPFSTLRFDREAEAWGLNVRRWIRRKNEEVYWSPIPREAFFFRISMAGSLEGLDEIRPSRQLYVKPFVVASLERERETEEELGTVDDTEVGLDVKWGVSKGLVLDLTLNTDFAETEVDDQRVNLTRFSLFFPEKREFFLENAGIFEFGSGSGGGGGGGGGRRSPLLKVFHSRRIGLVSGEEVPILYGARLTGRAGQWNVGVMDVLADEHVLEADGALVPETNFAVARLKRNIGQRSGVGFIFTDRDEADGGYNRVFGLDLDLKPTDKTYAAAFVTRNEDDSFEGGEWAAGAGGGYRGRELSASFDYTEASDLYNPDMGFLRRTDFLAYKPSVEWEPRLEKHGIRNFQIGGEMDYFARSSDHTMESRVVELQLFGLRTLDQHRFSLERVLNSERLFEPFEISDGVVITPGRYDFDQWEIGGGTNSSLPLSVFGRLADGDFFDGERLSTFLAVNARVSRYFKSRTEFSYNDVDLPAGSFITRLVGQRFDFSFNPDLVLNVFAQFNDSAELATLNVRLNWIYKPGADLFVVYNHNWEAPHFDDRFTTGRQLVLKYTYLFQR
jgi:hypothetical protein